jgi:hypothetical protein
MHCSWSPLGCGAKALCFFSVNQNSALSVWYTHACWHICLNVMRSEVFYTRLRIVY